MAESSRAKDVFEFEAIGTRWQIDLWHTQKRDGLGSLESKVKNRIDEFDKNYSRFRSDSLISEMARRGGEYILPNDAQVMFDIYARLYHLTLGVFTPLIGRTLEEAGYDATYTLVPRNMHSPPAWNNVLEYVFPRLLLKKPALLDLGALGKGHLVDIVGEILEAEGFDSYIIDAGGDMRIRGTPEDPLRVGLEHPEDSQSAIGVARVKGGSICCSAGNRRAWATFHHIIDPRSLSSPRHILATWTRAKTTVVADATATALFLADSDKLKEGFDFEYLILYPDHSIEKSDGFEAEIFTRYNQ